MYMFDVYLSLICIYLLFAKCNLIHCISSSHSTQNIHASLTIISTNYIILICKQMRLYGHWKYTSTTEIKSITNFTILTLANILGSIYDITKLYNVS